VSPSCNHPLGDDAPTSKATGCFGFISVARP
jgi:hypothetical protein